MTNLLKLLEFEDWLKTKQKDENWITVAQNNKFENNGIQHDYFTLSIISDCTETDILIEGFDWFSQVEFGNPEVWTDYFDKDELNYNPNNIIEKNGIVFEPFIIYRSWHKKSLRAKFNIIQDFILFYNLYFDAPTKTFKAISETGEEYDVIKITHGPEIEKIEINTKFLRNYLSLKNKKLIRQHEITRFTDESIQSMIGKESDEKNIKGDDFNFKLIMVEQPCSSYNSFSRLLGKDIVEPYSKGCALLEWDKKFEKFVIGTDGGGNEIHSTCDDEKLSNFFKDKGTPHILTPVYFKREALKKYYDAPSKYTVTSSSVACDGLWLIHIDEYKDLIQVWLRDLGHIPYNEQRHWRQFNVVSKGISESRFKRDFMAEFCDPEDIMFRFHREFDEFQKKFEKNFGFRLFLPLKHEDSYIYDSIRIPLNNEQPEFDSQMSYISKILPDSIDIKSIRNYLIQLGVKPEELKEVEGKKIRCLEFFLDKNGLDSEIIQQLDIIQNIRSKCISHRRGDNCVKFLKSLGWNEKTNIEIFRILLNNLVLSFKKIL